MNNIDLIKKTREFLNNFDLDALFVNTTDEYLNEYNQLENNSRYYLTGFSGSTGDAVITKDNVFLFVDGRYHKQADDEVNPELVSVVKLDITQSQTTGIIELIKQIKNSGIKLGINTKKVSFAQYKKLKSELSEVKFIEFDHDPVIIIAKELLSNIKDFETHNEIQHDKITQIPLNISGRSAKDKLATLQQNLEKDELLVITKLEEIAYLTNLRSFEIPFNSSFKAKAIIEKEKCYIFCDLDLIEKKIATDLDSEFVFIHKDAFFEYVRNYLDKNLTIFINEASINLYTYRLLESTKNKITNNTKNELANLKSIKNDSELAHFQENFLKTDIVISRIKTWLNQNIESGNKISEYDLSKEVKKYYMEQGATSLSFETIAASGKNSAIVHYSDPSKDKFIEAGEFLLLDCGGYFEGGYATDITRTILVGAKSKAENTQKQVYTTVLKAFLNGLNYPIKDGTSGFDIDKKVREVINSNPIDGFVFSHSTGHGVGISVHEAPPGLSQAEQSKLPLKEGMVFTIEPGLYNDMWGGVRLENTVCMVQKNCKPAIKSLAKSNFDERLIDYSLLSEQEKIWLQEYQKKAID